MKSRNKLYRFCKTSIIGGFVVVLPMSILILIFNWLFGIISSNIAPISNNILDSIFGDTKDYNLLVDIFVILMIIIACFLIGLFVKTKIGKWFYAYIEKSLFSKIPGYKMVKETIAQLLSQEKGSAFSSVALCQIFGNDTLVTAFVTDKHENGYVTVFVPTGPNPTSGNIYHLKPEYVHTLDTSTEETMRAIISCGAGSKTLLLDYEKSITAERTTGREASSKPTDRNI